MSLFFQAFFSISFVYCMSAIFLIEYYFVFVSFGSLERLSNNVKGNACRAQIFV